MVVIAAILQAQWRSTRFFGRGSALTIVMGLFWYGIFAAMACGAGLSAAVVGQADLNHYLPLAFCGLCLYWQLIPLVTASMGASIDLRKLLPYPIPHRRLFLVEVMLRFTTGIEVMLVLTGGMIGLWSNSLLHGWADGLRLVAVYLVFVSFNLLLASGTRSLLERLLSRRRVREWVALFMAMIWVVPRFVAQTGIHLKWLSPAAGFLRSVGLPWTAAAHAAFLPVAGHSSPASWAWLAAWTLVAAWFGRTQFERNLRHDPQATQAGAGGNEGARTRSLAEVFYRLPGRLWRDPVAGMVEKELRSLVRTPRFRMVFVMGFTFGVMLWLPMVLGRSSHPTMTRYFLTIVCVYSLTLLGGVTYWNCFGFDRSAALFYFAAPLPMAQVLAAKNIAALVFVYLEVGVLSAITVVLRMGIGGAQILETLVVMGICAVYMLALGNVSSVYYPRALHPERVSQNPRGGFQGLVFLLYPLALVPVLLAYLARYAFSSQMAFIAVLALAAALAGALYKISLDSAVAAAAGKREILMAELTKGDGPLVGG